MANSEYKAISTEGWRVSLPFRVITSKSVYDIADNEDYNANIEALSNEQTELIEKSGIEYSSRDYLIHFGNGNYWITTVENAVQMLALKDGADLVQFENGNFGFVGYYNGFNENWFEVILTESLSEHTEVHGNLVLVNEDDLTWLYEIENESEVNSAVFLIEWSISAWYNTEEYPEYESVCIGDVIEEQLDDKCIEYEYHTM